METRIADANTIKYPLGDLLVRGSQNEIYAVKDKPHLVLIVAKDDLVKGKAGWSTTTACNVFELLKLWEVPVAYVERDNENSFAALNCTMLPYEVVVTREAHDSFLRRYPELRKGQRLPELFAEVFLKTRNRRWNEHELPCDDPFVHYSRHMLGLYHPGLPLIGQEPFLELTASKVFSQKDEELLLRHMEHRTMHAFEILELAWRKQLGQLVYCKAKYGLSQDGTLLLADISWRVVTGDLYIDHYIDREDASPEEVAARYEQVARATARFL